MRPKANTMRTSPLCVDPPLHEDDIPHIEDFYCHECQHIFFPSQFTGNRGAFGSLLDNLDKTNSRAFGLPQDIRNYFENVRTGPDGEYEELPAGKPVKYASYCPFPNTPWLLADSSPAGLIRRATMSLLTFTKSAMLRATLSCATSATRVLPTAEPSFRVQPPIADFSSTWSVLIPR